MMPEFPAILIGGPPHSGKSVLIYSLTRALREARISHYVLRACPDGEGDWAYQIPQEQVGAMRIKGEFTPEFTQTVVRYLQNRPLPLLVDVGGMPTVEQEEIFTHCTHAILLVAERADEPEAFQRDKQTWEALMARNDVPILELFRSDLHEVQRLKKTDPHQTITALERGNIIHGPAFETGVDHLASIMMYPERSLATIHKRMLPNGVHFIDLPSLAGQLGNEDRHWQPDDLPFLLAQVPSDQPIVVYGRSANWVYAALALAAQKRPFTMFDAKLGWVTPPTLPQRAHRENYDAWQTTLSPFGSDILLEMNTGSQYLDIDEPDRIPLPHMEPRKGVLLSGRIPLWLLVAVCYQLAAIHPWVAVYQPPLQAAMVVFSQTAVYQVGQLIPFTPPTHS